MDTLEEYKQYCKDQIYPGLRRYELSRILRLLAAVLLIILPYFLIWLYFLKDGFCIFTLLILLPVLLLCSIITIAITEVLRVPFGNETKAYLLEKILNYIKPEFEYLPEGHSDYDVGVIFGSKIFGRHFLNNYYISDKISGKIGKADFSIMCLQKGANNHYWIGKKGSSSFFANGLTFKGLLIAIDFNKFFYGTMIVLPNRKNSNKFADLSSTVNKDVLSMCHSIFNSRNFSGKRVKLDNIEFERVFNVYATDQVEARYILSHSFMEKLLEIQNKINKPMAISFSYCRIHIAIEDNEQIIFPSLIRSLYDCRYLEKSKNRLQSYIDIFDDLELNNRIWTRA